MMCDVTHRFLKSSSWQSGLFRLPAKLKIGKDVDHRTQTSTYNPHTIHTTLFMDPHCRTTPRNAQHHVRDSQIHSKHLVWRTSNSWNQTCTVASRVLYLFNKAAVQHNKRNRHKSNYRSAGLGKSIKTCFYKWFSSIQTARYSVGGIISIQTQILHCML